MKLTFSTLGCPGWTLEQIADRARKYGYDAVELRVADDGLHLSPDAPADEVRRAAGLFRQAGVPVAALAGYASFASPDPKAVERNRSLARKLIGIAEILGARHIRAYGGKVQEGEGVDAAAERIAAGIGPVAEEAAQRGVGLALETHDSWCAGADLAKVFHRLGGAPASVVFDVHNVLSATGEWRESYRQVRDHVAYWHVKDGYKTPSSGGLVMVGAGDLPLRDILRTLKVERFEGFLSFEWEKRWQPSLPEPEQVLPQYVYKMRSVWDEV